MATNPDDIHLSPEQRKYLAELADRSGKPWFELLQSVIYNRPSAETSSSGTETQKPIWEKFIEASLEIPEEELSRLATDGATCRALITSARILDNIAIFDSNSVRIARPSNLNYMRISSNYMRIT